MTTAPADARNDLAAGSRGSVRSWLPVAALGLASAAIYAWAFTLTWPLWQLWQQPKADYTWFGRYTTESQIQYIGAFLALFLWQAGNYFRRNRPGRYTPQALPPELMPRGD